jgi:hypothetical protein
MLASSVYQFCFQNNRKMFEQLYMKINFQFIPIKFYLNNISFE